MTTADSFGPPARPLRLLRWALATTFICSVHAAFAVFLIAARDVPAPAEQPPAAILIDLQAAAPAPEQTVEPTPVLAMSSEADIPEPSPEPGSQPIDDAEEAAVSLHQVVEEPGAGLAPPGEAAVQTTDTPELPRPRPTPTRPRESRRSETPAAAAARTMPEPPEAAAPAQPVQTASATAPAIASGSGYAKTAERWRSQLARHLESKKRYPREAQVKAINGTVQVSFTIDAHGLILSHRITRSSGYAVLDQAVEDMLARANPVPAPPNESFTAGMTVQVPIRFFAN